MIKLLHEIRKAERNYRISKVDLDLKKAELWLNSNWEEIFPKKPTVKDKESYIDTQLSELIYETKAAEIEYHNLTKIYEIYKNNLQNVIIPSIDAEKEEAKIEQETMEVLTHPENYYETEEEPI